MAKERRGAGRRKNGEGSPYQRKDGSWALKISLPDGTRRTVSGATMADAQAAATDARRKAKREQATTGGNTRLADYLVSWLTDQKALTLKPHTLHVYSIHCRHVSDKIGAVRLADLQPPHISRCITALLADGLSPHTVHTTFTCLKSALTDAVRWRIIEWNPAVAVDPPSFRLPTMTTLTLTQSRQLWDSVQDNPWQHALWRLLIMTGLRIGEATGLTWANVDYKGDKILTVLVTKSQIPGGGLELTEPKTPASKRMVYLPPAVCDALRIHHLEQRKAQLSTLGWQDRDIVFPNAHGGLIATKDCQDRLDAAIEAAGLPRVQLHELRHTCATIHLHEFETPVKMVSEMLGHANIRVTLDLYGHVLPAMHRQTAEAWSR